MKKLFICVAIFAVISVSITGILISTENHKGNNSISFGDKNDDLTINNIENMLEKTIDLHGTYNENDLLVNEKKEIFKIANEDVEIEIPQIKGLKNKTIENKINNDMINRISEIINNFSNNSEIKKFYSSYETMGNFSNVLWNVSYEDDRSHHYKKIGMNYELINGEKLKVEDLFVDDMDYYYDNVYYYYFKDIANEVTIYDKYLTKESIYEFKDIGLKNLWTCSVVSDRDAYEEYGFPAENLYCDIYCVPQYKVDQDFRNMRKKLIELVHEKVEEYKKIAMGNPQRFYILYFDIDIEKNSYRVSNPDTITIEVNELVETTNITNKQKVMGYLLDCYRYYNLFFHGSGMDYASFGNDMSSSYDATIFDSIEGKNILRHIIYL